MSPVRHLVFAVVALLACLVLPVAVVSLWTDSVVTDTDAYVDTVGPLADDPVVQEFVQQRLVAETRSRLPLAPPRLVDRAATRVVQGPEFRPAWEQANREAHRQMIAVLDADSDSPVADDGTVTLQIGPLVVAVVKAVDPTGRVDTSTVPDIETTVRLIPADDLQTARTYYRIVDEGGFWLPVLWAVLVAVALLVAVRRLRALVWLGVGSAVTMCGLLLAIWSGRSRVEEQAPSGQSDLVGSMYDVLVSGLRELSWFLFGIALAVAIVAAALAFLVGRVRPREA
ncbi:MAG: hypothetical protein ABWX84_00885 [Nocardioides sp.]